MIRRIPALAVAVLLLAGGCADDHRLNTVADQCLPQPYPGANWADHRLAYEHTRTEHVLAVRREFSWTSLSLPPESITITSPPCETSITVTDDSVLGAVQLQQLFLLSEEVERPPGGSFRPDVPPYVYDIVVNNERHCVRVVRRGVIEIVGTDRYFRTSPNVHQLGNAFMPAPPHVDTRNPFLKIAHSGLLWGEQAYAIVDFCSSRLYDVALVLSQHGQIVDEASFERQAGGRLERLTFLYYGQAIVLEVYEHHVAITDEGQTTYLELEDAYLRIHTTLVAG